MTDDRPKCQLRVTRKELSLLLRTLDRASWSEEDERVRAAVALLAPDLAAETGRGPMLFEIVVIEPPWLLTTGEVRRWAREPIPKETPDV